MSVTETWWRRPGLIARLIEKAPGLGRTAIMKLPYLLQTLRDVPLGYDFRLYTYGPFDSDVLNDLAYAEAVEAVTEETVYYPNGYGYQIQPGPRCAEVQALATDWLAQYEDEINWAVREFAGCTAAELELISTIIFVDRENGRQGHSILLPELARRVGEVKPHFAQDHVLAKCRGAKAKGYLKAVATA